MVRHKNIHLFSFNNRTDITTDLNNYKDETHYGTWINSLILKWMHDGQYQLTVDNYKDYLKSEYSFYTTFDYVSINGQEDYEADFYAAALLNKELTGVEPLVNSNNGVENIQFDVDLDEGYNYFCFNYQKLKDAGNLAAYVYDGEETVVGQIKANHPDSDNNVHQCVIDLSTVSGKVTAVLRGDSLNNNDGSDAYYRFTDVCVY